MANVAQTATRQATDRTGMALSDYLRRSFAGERFEIIEGELVAMSPTIAGHGYLANSLADLLKAHILPANLGVIFVEMTYTTTEPDDPNWVIGSLTPDVMFISQARMAAYQQKVPDWKQKPLASVSDLVVEIISPTDTYKKALGKAARYFKDGVRLVWLIDFERQTITVCHRNQEPFLLSDQQRLTGEDVIPGFSIEVDRLFSA